MKTRKKTVGKEMFKQKLDSYNVNKLTTDAISENESEHCHAWWW